MRRRIVLFLAASVALICIFQAAQADATPEPTLHVAVADPISTAAALPSQAITLSIHPSALAFLGALALFGIGFAAFYLAPKLRDDEEKKLVFGLSLVALSFSLLLIIATAMLPANLSDISLIPLGSGGEVLLRLFATVVAICLIALSMYLSHRGRAAQWRFIRGAILTLLGFAGAVSFCFGRLMPSSDAGAVANSRFLATLSSTYAPELGPHRIYECALAVWHDVARPEELAGVEVRDPIFGRIVPADTLVAQSSECRERFSTERWLAFERDVKALVPDLAAAKDSGVLTGPPIDEGPLWFTISNLVSIDSSGGVDALTVTGFALLAGAAVASLLAFGWQSACFAALFLGVFQPLYSTTALVTPADCSWLAALLVTLSLLRRQSHVCAGITLSIAIVLRPFVACFLLGPLIRTVWLYISTKQLDRAVTRHLIGVLLGVAVIVPVSFAALGPEAASFYSDAFSRHHSQPVRKALGLEALLAHSPNLPAPADSALPTEATPATGAMLLRILGYATALGLAWSCLRLDDRLWVLGAFGFALTPIALSLPGEYLSFLAVAAFFLREDIRIPLLLFLLTLLCQVISLVSVSPGLLISAQTVVLLYFCLECLLTFKQRLAPDASPTR